MEKALLGQIANIQLGFSFRTEVERDAHGKFRLVQIKDLGQNRLDLEGLTPIPGQDWSENYLLQEGDLVFRSRNGNFGFITVPDGHDRLVLSSPLYRVRPDSKQILPEYLVWFSGLRSTQDYFAKVSEGTALKMINRQSLENLPISWPDRETQRKIVEIIALKNRDDELVSAIQGKKRLLTQGILENLLR